MIGFPFDSLVTYDEYGNPIFDRAVSSKPLKSLISKLFTTGVMPNPSDNFQVFAGTEGMTVVVHAGYAVIDGGLKLEENNRTLEIQASDSNYDRIDTVILRWNGNDNARVCDLYVLEGTPAPNPVRPELTRAGSIYEIGLADIIIPRNTGAISQQRITDTRYDSERCGIVSSVSEFDTTTLYAQVQADLADFKAEEQADFIAWFNTIKDKLDEADVAVLQGEIDDINEPTITEASTRANIVTGDTYPTILGKIKKFFSDLKAVAFSGSYNDLSNRPNLATVATSGSYNDLSNRPNLASVATSGNASDLSYSNTTSGLSATKAQGAIDELASEKADKTGSVLLAVRTTNTSYKYARILRIRVNASYIGSYPLVVEISGRWIPRSFISISFKSVANTDPSIESVRIDRKYPVYLVKTNTSTWDLIVPYVASETAQTWSDVCVHSIGGSFDYNLIDLTVNGNLDSLPSGTVVKVNPIWTAGQVTISYGTTGSFKIVDGPMDANALGFVSRVSGSANCNFRIYPNGSSGQWYIHADGLSSGETVTVNYAIYCEPYI